MPTTTTRILAINTVLDTRSVVPYLVYVTVFIRYHVASPARALRCSESESVNNGRDTTGGLAYNHLTRLITSYGDGKVV
jgi:hypothetical protein